MRQPQEYLLKILLWQHGEKCVYSNPELNRPPRKICQAPSIEEAENEELGYWSYYDECAG